MRHFYLALCTLCNVPESVKHLLLQCPLYGIYPYSVIGTHYVRLEFIMYPACSAIETYNSLLYTENAKCESKKKKKILQTNSKSL